MKKNNYWEGQWIELNEIELDENVNIEEENIQRKEIPNTTSEESPEIKYTWVRTL